MDKMARHSSGRIRGELSWPDVAPRPKMRRITQVASAVPLGPAIILRQRREMGLLGGRLSEPAMPSETPLNERVTIGCFDDGLIL